MPCRKAQGDAGGAPDVEVHPAFPSVPGSVPLTFALTMQACLAPSPTDRPSFEQVLTLLHDCASEVAVGEYINAAGLIQVCPSSTPVISNSSPSTRWCLLSGFGMYEQCD